MSIPNHNLTKDEEILHHYAATLKKRLEAYHACESRDENTWANEFKASWYICARSMMYFTNAIDRSGIHPRMHLLFLSLTEAISESGNTPDISSVSENDPRALRSNYYTAPSDLPPLDIHFNGQNECMVSQTQDDLANTGGAEMNVPSAVCNLENVLSQREELLVEATDATVNIPRSVEKHYGAPSDKCKVDTRSAAKRKVAEWVETTAASASKGNAGDDENAPRLQDKYKGMSAVKASFQKRTRSQVKANGKQTKKIDSRRHKSPNLEDSHDESWQDEPVSVEESPSRRQDGRNEEGSSCKDNDKTFKDLKLEVQALMVRCNEYERIMKDLQSACDTHENILKMLRQQIVNLHDSRGTLSSAYGGKNYDLIS
ncbi:hypothetical protein EI94DRAFT_1704359 [Lactarius quietus]|nr:hypothetical protein EI94DRAFT_1704359 [Lactarius quietus]